MTKLLTKAIEFLGLGLVMLGLLITVATLRAHNFNLYIFGTGILLITVPVVIYFIVEKTRDKTDRNEKLASDLKQTGIRIPVDLTKCSIKSNNWTEEVSRDYPARVTFLNEVSGNSDKNIELVESDLSIIEYRCDFQGRRRTFVSATIAKDKITVTLLLEMQKETSIYVDRDDNRYYHFDLEFLD